MTPADRKLKKLRRAALEVLDTSRETYVESEGKRGRLKALPEKARVVSDDAMTALRVAVEDADAAFVPAASLVVTLDLLITALKDVTDPIGYQRRKAERQRKTLDGYVARVQAVNISFIQGIAQEALDALAPVLTREGTPDDPEGEL